MPRMSNGPTCFVTGGTGFLGRHVIAELLQRGATVYAMVRPQSTGRLAKIATDLGVDPDRLIPVPGDIALDRLTLEPFAEQVDHLFHLAAIYDMDADPDEMAEANVEGTRRVLAFAGEIGAGTFHMVSSIAAAGDLAGTFPEEDPRHGQGFPHAYHRSKYDSEVLVRDTATMPYRIYRPGTVVGTTDTGQTDKLDGAYALFPLAAALGTLPSQMVVPVPRMGRLPTVPVDRCAQAIAQIGLTAGPDAGDTFGLYAAGDERVHQVLGALVQHAGGPRIAAILPEVTGTLPFIAAQILGRVPVVGDARNRALNALGVSPGLIDAAPFRCRFETTRTQAALAGTGIEIPPLRDYLPVLWDGWRRMRAAGA
jgi:thioester reductase-like protein